VEWALKNQLSPEYLPIISQTNEYELD